MNGIGFKPQERTALAEIWQSHGQAVAEQWR
jgi:hypothetical protein